METIGTPAALLKEADAFAALAGLERSTVSLKLFNDGKRLDGIAAGGDTRTKALERAWANLAKLKREHAKANAPARKRA
ncbi:MAG: hypothetical protein NW206_19700 [Hyphomonadaceae bacterium]|nr:hypothetical protein [Hyphomonadaceae bacterium]